jgi:hypothetical protein
MSKIPVGYVIGQTYRFSFARYFTILGIIWLPLFLMLAVGYFLLLPMMQEFSGLLRNMMQHPGDPAAAAAFNGKLGRLYGFDLLALLFAVWIQVGITKEVLGLRTGPRFVFLPSGADEGRVALSYLILTILAYIAIFVVIIVAAIVGALLFAGFVGGAAKGFDVRTLGPLGAALVVVLALGFYLAIFYIFIRLLFFVGPATVAERHMILNRSWQLTRGNFWRIFAVLLATLLPLYLVQSVVMGVMMWPAIHQLLTMPANADPAAFVTALWTNMARFLPYYIGAGFLLAPVFYGLFVSQAAFAYRALVPAAEVAA